MREDRSSSEIGSLVGEDPAPPQAYTSIDLILTLRRAHANRMRVDGAMPEHCTAQAFGPAERCDEHPMLVDSQHLPQKTCIIPMLRDFGLAGSSRR